MLVLGAIGVVYVLLAASSKPEHDSGLMRFAVGEMSRLAVLEAPPPMPTRPLRDAEGRELSLADFAGEVVVVNIWATSCAPCLEEMPTLAQAQQRHQGRLRIVAISVDGEAGLDRAKRQLNELSGGVLPFYIDISRGVLFDTRATGMPITIIYDRQGREVARLAGGADWAGEDAGALFEAVLSEP